MILLGDNQIDGSHDNVPVNEDNEMSPERQQNPQTER